MAQGIGSGRSKSETPEPEELNTSARLMIELCRNLPMGEYLEYRLEDGRSGVRPFVHALWAVRSVPLGDLVNTVARAFDDLADGFIELLLSVAPEEKVTADQFAGCFSTVSYKPDKPTAFDRLARAHPDVAGLAYHFSIAEPEDRSLLLAHLTSYAAFWFSRLDATRASRAGIQPKNMWLVEDLTDGILQSTIAHLYWSRQGSSLGETVPAQIVRQSWREARTALLDQVKRGRQTPPDRCYGPK